MPFRSTTATRSRPMIECAQCGEALYLPEWSELNAKRAIMRLRLPSVFSRWPHRYDIAGLPADFSKQPIRLGLAAARWMH